MDLGFAELAFTVHCYGMKKQEMGNQAMDYAKLRKATIGFVVSVCRFARNISDPTGWIFIKFDI
jgi:hypothetical protein